MYIYIYWAIGYCLCMQYGDKTVNQSVGSFLNDSLTVLCNRWMSHIYCNNWRFMSVILDCLSIVIVVFIHTGILCVIVGADI